MEEAIVETKKTGLRYALKALFQNTEPAVDIKELEKLENVQKSLKKGKKADYITNIKATCYTKDNSQRIGNTLKFKDDYLYYLLAHDLIIEHLLKYKQPYNLDSLCRIFITFLDKEVRNVPYFSDLHKYICYKFYDLFKTIIVDVDGDNINYNVLYAEKNIKKGDMVKVTYLPNSMYAIVEMD